MLEPNGDRHDVGKRFPYVMNIQGLKWREKGESY